MQIVRKLKRKYKSIQSDWISDLHFSENYAKQRRKETVCSMLRMKKTANNAFKKREQFIISYLTYSVKDVIEKYRGLELYGKPSKNVLIWICWWTGLETAPPIVKQCVKSIYKNAGNHQIVFLTKNNFKKYVQVPGFIMKKMNEGKIGLAHFADYLRVSLLEKYGGLWLDATIFCSQPIPERFFELPFFTLKSPYTESKYISKFQWVTFCLGGFRGNQFYSFLREAFELYWSTNDYAIDYLFFDYLIYIARENNRFIKLLMENVPENTLHRDDLQAAMNAGLPAEQFYKIVKSDTELYKLSWRETYSTITSEGNPSVYDYFLSMCFDKQ